MGSPVEFTVSLSPLAITGSLTPQQLAQAIVDRLTIAPQEPWTSFQVVTSLPLSDIGPVVYNRAWYIWNTGTGSYQPHVQNGSGLVDATVTLAKLAKFSNAGAVLISNGSKVPTELAAGTDGKVLKLVSGLPAWSSVPTSTRFEATLGSDQNIDTDSSYIKVTFDTITHSNGVTFDTVNNRVPVLKDEVWFLYAGLQVEDVAAASTGVQLEIRIREGGGTTGPGAVANVKEVSTRFGVYAGGVVVASADGYFDVAISATEDTPATPGLAIAANANNTRFGGFRLL